MTLFRLRLFAVLFFSVLGLLALRFRPNQAVSVTSEATPSRGSINRAAAPNDSAVCVTPGETPTPSFAALVAAKAARDAALAATAAFEHWLTDFRRAEASAQSALATTGLPLAATRRAALKYLIETDPERALTLAVPVGLRPELPADIQAQLERRLDQRGRLEVSISHLGNTARLDRVVRVGDTDYRTFVFGRREAQQTKYGLPLHGIAIDDAFALASAPLRVLDDTEKLTHGLTPDSTAAFVGGQLTVLASPAELAQLETRLLETESTPGPHLPVLASGSPTASTAPGLAALTSPTSWIHGAKRVLWLKVDFSDDPGASHTDAEIQASSAGISDFYAANSQGKTTLTFSIIPTPLRLPRPKSYYETSGSTSGTLQTEARDAAKAYDAANGGTGAWDPDRFDRYIVVHKRISVYLYGGVAQLGGPRVDLNNTVGVGTTTHEIGHNQSLAHSHYWLPSGTNAAGPGAHVEYGDIFDVMGTSSAGGAVPLHFNAPQKAKLGYLDPAAITAVTTAGTYRIARHDDKEAAGVRALKIAPVGLGFEYWVEHRRVAPASFNAAQRDRLLNGALIHWGPDRAAPSFTTGQGTYLLDATPASAAGANDAPFRIGESFVDPDAGLTIKPLATGGTAPNEYLDVQVSFGAIDGNRNPVLAADAPAGPLKPRTNITLSASATDPDGDPLYYRWDFGDRSLEPNLPSITRRFAKGGVYSLRVSAHDGKGGIDARTLALTVSDPLTTWTQRTSGVTNTLYAAIYAGGKFVVAGDNGVNLWSTDGVTWTRGSGIPNTHFPRSIAHNGARFVTVGPAGANATLRATSAYSNDGVTWAAATVPTGVGTMNAIAFGAGRFVAVGETGRIYHSIDGTLWTEVTSPVTTSFSAVAFADNLFVATGASGRIFTSTDGTTWVNRSVTTGNTVNSVARHEGQWFAAVSAFECFVSTDGTAWTRVATAGRTNSNNGQRLVSAAGVLLSSTNAGGITFAEDPRTWSEHQINATPSTVLYGLAEGAGQIVVVGVRGLIYTTTSEPASPPLPAPSLRLEADSIKVAVGRKNVLAASGSGFVKLELYANGTKVSELAGTAGALTWTPPTLGNYVLAVRGIDATGASVVSVTYPAVAAFDGWRWRNPGPVGTDLRGAVRVDDKWWIVGGGGTLMTLDDAGNFTAVDFSTTQQLNSIAYANGRFMIATTDLDGATKEDIGGLWTSADGYTWTVFLTGAVDGANLTFALYAANRWIGFGQGGTIVTSTDGVSWPRSSSGLTTTINSAVEGPGLVVAVGASGRIITSPDGLTWTAQTSGVTTNLNAVAFANSSYVAAGASGVILTSRDGVTWTRPTSGVTTALNAAAFVKGAFVVGGDNGVLLSSPDGTTWSAVSLSGNLTGTLFLSGAGGEGLLLGRGGESYAATTATSWRRLFQGTAEAKQAVIYADGRFVSVGTTTDPVSRATFAPVQVSTDGITWTRANANSAFLPLTAIAYGQQRYVAVGPASAIFTSPDGRDWTRRTATFTTTFSSIAAGPALYVAGSSGATLYTSPDGTTWTSRTFAPAFPVRGAAYGNSRYVIVGDTGNIRHSTDGLTWTAATSGVTTHLLAVGWWEDVGFLATGNAGVILNSTDGLTWQQRESGVSENIGAIAKTPIGYVAAGGVQGTLLVSLDGISWSLSAVPLDRTVRGLAASASSIIAVGDGGATLGFDLSDTGAPPIIVAQPLSRSGVMGDTVRFSVSAQNATGAVYQWLKDGVPISGANTPLYTIASAAPTHAGAYSVAITSSTGVVTSAPASLTFAAPTNPGRLINLSILTSLTSASDNFTFGVVVGGAGTGGGKGLLVRAAGPSLGALGVGGTLEDPKLEFFTGSTKVGENDDWGGVASTSAVMASVGAFAFSAPNSKDAAISFLSLASGANSAKISGTGAGMVIAELYDATPAAAFTATTPRLINVSVLKHLGTGVTAGFVIGGSTARTVLIRAIGPTLGGFGVADTVADPQLALFSGQTERARNDNWGGGTALAAAFAQVGAFGLAADSRDAALLATLAPGNYTVQVSGVAGTTGVALVEVYEVP